MDAITARPSLLSAAKNFIRKSAGTAVVVIAPLAAISLANSAKGQTAFFGGAHETSGAHFFTTSGSGSGSSTASSPSGFFSISSGGTTRFGQSATTTNIDGSYFSGHLDMNFYSNSGSTSGSLPVGSSTSFNYNFTLTPTGDTAYISWTLNIYLYDQIETPFYQQISDSSVGDVSGSTFLTINSTDNPNGLPNLASYYAALSVNFTTTTLGDSLSVVMDKNVGQGLALTAIPEPSTLAAIFGLSALGFVMLRRSRRAAA